MRDIKFRAWSNSRNKMVDCTVNMIVMWPNMRAVEYDSAGKQVDMELMQFTGLKDKNGVDIYEGDIVHWGHVEGYVERKPRKAVVEFSPEIAFKSFNLGENNHRFGLSNFAYARVTNKAMEVIGNIHQNPELLEVSA